MAGGMRAVSEAERTAESGGGGPAPAVLVREGTWLLPQPMPSEHLPKHTLSYLLQDSEGDLHVVDPGVDDDRNLDRLFGLIRSIGSEPSRLRTVVSTHLHHDHLGLAGRLRRETGAVVAIHRAEQEAVLALTAAAPTRVADDAERAERWGVPAARRAELADVAARAAHSAPFEADLLLEHDDLLPVPGRRIRVLHTPGHTPGHLALVEERKTGTGTATGTDADADARGLLFTGDLLLPTIYPGLGLGGQAEDPVADYLASLDSLAPYADFEVLPGHGFRFIGAAQRIEETRHHHLTRSAEIAALHRSDPAASVWQIASGVAWTAGFENLSGFYLYSALSQTAQHLAHLERESAPSDHPAGA